MAVSKPKIKSEKLKVETEKISVRKISAAKIAVASLSAPVFDSKGAKSGTVALPKEIFGVKVNQPLMAQAVRVYLANQRTGTSSTKTRGEVTGSTRKIYRQKGTGRARHGGVRAPIFVGGGVAFGPKPRDFSLKLPKKMKKVALYSALSLKASMGEVKVLTGLSKIEPKTKNMNTIIKKISSEKRILLVTPSKEMENIKRAGRNIENLEISDANLLNTYQVLKSKELFLMKESIETLTTTK